MRVLRALICAYLITPSAVAAEHAPSTQKYFGIILHSLHAGAKTQAATQLNDQTPGFSFGKRYNKAKRRYQSFVEAGIFYNSYEEISPFILGGLSTPLVSFPTGDIWLSGFVGAGYYGELSTTLKSQHGIPNIGGVVPLAGFAISYRTQRNELRLTTVPSVDLDAIVNISFTRTY